RPAERRRPPAGAWPIRGTIPLSPSGELRARSRRMRLPELRGQEAERDEGELRGDEARERPDRAVHETVGVQPDAEHVHAEPGEAGDDVATDGHRHDPLLADVAAKARVEDEGVPQYDEERAVLLRVPAPESSPRLVGPDSAQDGADEAEEQREADDPVGHGHERLAGRRIEPGRELPAEGVADGEGAGEEGAAVPDGD